jgi:hypothetical protein
MKSSDLRRRWAEYGNAILPNGQRLPYRDPSMAPNEVAVARRFWPDHASLPLVQVIQTAPRSSSPPKLHARRRQDSQCGHRAACACDTTRPPVTVPDCAFQQERPFSPGTRISVSLCVPCGQISAGPEPASLLRWCHARMASCAKMVPDDLADRHALASSSQNCSQTWQGYWL